MEKILEFLRATQVFYLATIDGDQPRVRPFGFAMEHEGKIYFCTGGPKPVCRQLIENPKFEACACDADGKWLRLTARAVIDKRPELKEKAFAAMPTLKDIYDVPGAPEFVMFYADKGEAVFADMRGNVEKIAL